MAPKAKTPSARHGEELERECTSSRSGPACTSLPRRRRAGHALETVRRFVVRHMKGRPEDVWIDPRLNEHIWERGVQHIPSQVRVKAIRFEDGLIEVDLLEAE